MAGVFACSEVSDMGSYLRYGKGILEAVYVHGSSRLGDAIASSRIQYCNYFMSAGGVGKATLGQFNLLGDPALDIGDRVRYPSNCDLVVFQGDVTISEYPVETATGTVVPVSFRIRNNGAQDSGAFTTRLVFTSGQNISSTTVSCGDIEAGEQRDYSTTWNCPSWFTPPMDVTVEIEADYLEVCSDSWRGNNTSEHTLPFKDIYPFDSDWGDGSVPLYVEGVINTTPILTNLDTDDELEVVTLTGTSLTAFEDDGTVKWVLSGEGFSASFHPMAEDLDNDGRSEILLRYSHGLKIIDPDGRVQQTIQNYTSAFVLGDMDTSESGFELCIASGRTIHLYEWDGHDKEFDLSLTRELTELPSAAFPQSLSCADLDGSSCEDVVLCVRGDEGDIFIGALVYDWDSDDTVYYKVWQGKYTENANPAVGDLSGDPLVGYPFGQYDSSEEQPAALIDPGQSTYVECEKGTADASNLNYGVYADWDPLVTGADAFILPSEMQCLAWNNLGQELTGWPTPVYSGSMQGSGVSPTALGDLNSDDDADVLFSTICKIIAFSMDGSAPLNSDFPYTLPEEVRCSGGFALADIDNDEMLEMVFVTTDHALHCWELDDCDEGYTPWPQFQHDSARTGVLE